MGAGLRAGEGGTGKPPASRRLERKYPRQMASSTAFQYCKVAVQTCVLAEVLLSCTRTIWQISVRRSPTYRSSAEGSEEWLRLVCE